MLRIFVRQLLLRSFSPIRTSYLKNIVNASLYCRYCTSANVEVADKIASKNIPGNYDVKSIEQLKRIFKCTDEEAKRVFQQIDPLDLKLLRKKFLFLTKNGATLPVLMDHCHLLNMSTGKCHQLQATPITHLLNLFLSQSIYCTSLNCSGTCHGEKLMTLYHFWR